MEWGMLLLLMPLALSTSVLATVAKTTDSEGWSEVQSVAVDMDGDGTVERVSLRVNATRLNGELQYDDSHWWQVIICEGNAEQLAFKTYITLGNLNMVVAKPKKGSPPSLWLVRDGDHYVTVMELTYSNNGYQRRDVLTIEKAVPSPSIPMPQ